MRALLLVGLQMLALMTGCRAEEREDPVIEKSTPAPTPAPPPQCGGAPCLEVPTGIKGLSFGMAPDEVKAALKDPDDWEEPNRPHVVHPAGSGPVYSWEKAEARPFAQRVPGVSTTVTTTLGGAESMCRLDFDDGRRLVGIACRVERGDTPIEALFESIAATLGGRHGPPVHRDNRPVGGMTGSVRRMDYLLVWKSLEAILELRLGESSAFGGAESLDLENHTPVHAARLHRAQVEADRAEADAREAKLAAARAAKAERERAFREGQKALGNDLSGAPEKP